MNNNTPSGAISLDELNNMPGMEMPAGPGAIDIVTPTAAPATPATPTIPTPGTIGVEIPTTPIADSEPVIVPTEAEATEASPNIAGGGAIDLSELANMSDAAFDTMAAANENAAAGNIPETNAATGEAQPRTLTEEEIAANEAQARAASEANLAEASASMQNMHQNIMADVKPKEKEEIAQASISSKSRRKKVNKKVIIIAIIAILVLGAGGTLTYLLMTGFFNMKEYVFGKWSVKIDESVYNIDSSDTLKLTAKDGSYFINYTDIGELDHKGLLNDTAGMKSMLAESGYKIDSANEEINGVVSCAVYKLIDRNKNNNIVYSGYCNIGENMFNILAGANNTDNDAARAAFDKSIDIVRNAKRK